VDDLPFVLLLSMDAAEITVPVALPSAALARELAKALQGRLRLLWALDEIRAGRMTRVRAAAWLGLPLDEFHALADTHGLPAFDYEPDDFKSEFASLTRSSSRTRRHYCTYRGSDASASPVRFTSKFSCRVRSTRSSSRRVPTRMASRTFGSRSG
jgi:hypothetical protein